MRESRLVDRLNFRRSPDRCDCFEVLHKGPTDYKYGDAENRIAKSHMLSRLTPAESDEAQALGCDFPT